MATSALEHGARGQERGPRGCEHYDRGCLLKVTTSMGFSPTDFPRARLWAGWVRRLGMGLGVYQDTFFTSGWVPVLENVFGKVPTFRPVLCFASRALLGKILGLHTFI